MASIGSIEHILRTAFKDVYEEKEKRDNARKAREFMKLRLMREEEKRIRAKEAEDERLRVEAEEAAKKSKDKKGSQAKKDMSKSKSQRAGALNPPSPSTVSSTVPASESRSEEENEEERVFIETFKDYYPSLENMELEEYLKDSYHRGIEDIENNLRNKHTQASELLKYLEEQRIIAKKEEEDEEERLKKQGIIVGQHIPALKSHLIIDRERIESCGNISNNLIIASELMQQNHVNMLRRSGNLPITELMERRMMSRSLRKSQAMSRRTSEIQSPNIESIKKP